MHNVAYLTFCCFDVYTFGAVEGRDEGQPKYHIIPSLQVLALKLCLKDKEQAKLLPCFLRCFPNISALHIEVRVAPSLFTSLLKLRFETPPFVSRRGEYIKIVNY